MKNSNDTIGNRTRDLPACSAVPQPTAPPCAPNCAVRTEILYIMWIHFCFTPTNFKIWPQCSTCSCSAYSKRAHFQSLHLNSCLGSNTTFAALTSGHCLETCTAVSYTSFPLATCLPYFQRCAKPSFTYVPVTQAICHTRSTINCLKFTSLTNKRARI